MVVWNILNNPKWRELSLSVLTTDVFLEFIGMQILAPFSSASNGITWYISALLLWLPLFVYLLRNHEKATYFISFFVGIFVYGFFLSKWNHIDFGFVWIGFANGGFVRALGGMSIGVFLFYIYLQISQMHFTKKAHIVFFAIQVIFMAFVFYSAWKFRQKKIDFVELILIATCIPLAFIENIVLKRLLNNKIVFFLGGLCYPIYLNQLFVAVLSRIFFNFQNQAFQTFFYIALLIAFSLIADCIVKHACKNLAKFKPFFIEKNDGETYEKTV